MLLVRVERDRREREARERELMAIDEERSRFVFQSELVLVSFVLIVATQV